MSMNDLMSDFVARINNARLANNVEVSVLKNKLATATAKKLTTLGYLTGFVEGENRTLVLSLNLDKIHAIQRVSKPGQRVYISFDGAPKVVGGRGFNIITTSQGVMTHFEAGKAKVGGEVLFQIY
jgi:small subunit ribosomal protein S8